MTDRGESDRRGDFSERPNAMRSVDVRKMPAQILAFLLIVSPLTFLVGFSLIDSPQAEGPDVVTVILATGTPPVFVISPPADIFTNKGDITNFLIVVRDVDNDTVNVTWDWGDGTTPGVNITPPAATNFFVRTTHVYDPYVPGRGEYQENFTLNVTLDDGNGNLVYRNSVVHVNMPPNQAPSSPTIVGPAGIVDPADVVTISANASDLEGDELSWTFVFNDSVEDYLIVTDHTPRTAPNETAWSNVSLTLDNEGFFNITVYVSDALPPYQVFPHNVSDRIGPIRAIFNRMPNASDNISASPPSPIINATIGYIEVNYTLDAFDQDGDFLNVTWNFGDGTDNITETSQGGTRVYRFYQVRNYTDAGVFNITALITDGRAGHDILLNLTMTVMSTNRPPDATLSVKYSTGNFALPNETLNFTLVFTDSENNPLEVIVDWGDDSPWLFLNLTEYVDGNITVLLNHTYASIGKYNITVWYTDHKIGLFDHNKNLTNLVRVDVPPPIVHHYWSWWDFTSLFLFLMIPVSFTLRFLQVARKRRKLEEEGLTLEEWKLVRSETEKDVSKKEEP